MPADPRIVEFLAKALANGIPQESLIGILTSQGWPEKEIYEALTDHYRRTTGIEIPRRSETGTSAKEAFFYLLTFATLATWTISLGCLAFTLIDRWLPDPVFSSSHVFDTYTITSSLAALMVAFPIFLLISRATAGDIVEHPEKRDSSIRKWLTYMALVIAAGVFMGDLIAALAYLLRGELTSRFLAKSFVVLALSGGVFFYYFGGLRNRDATPSKLNRDRLMAEVCSAIVVLIIVLGFFQLGSPNVQRDFRADSQRLSRLYQLSNAMRNYWTSHDSQLPTNIEQLPGILGFDPITGKPYEYRPEQGSRYELCATFARRSPRQGDTLGPNPWTHPAGHYCFHLDAVFIQPFPQQYFGN